jgi:uncharacterized protein (DUF2147 family)
MFLAGGLAPAMALDPTGDWRVADGVAIIRVAPCNGSMWGAVAWEQAPGGRDTHNPDASKQNRPVLGMPILIDMKKQPGSDQWDGQVYNAKDGQYYSSTIKPLDPDHLEIRGCVLGFLCGGETWTRVDGPLPPSPANGTATAPAKPAVSPGLRTTGAATAPSPKPTSGKKPATAAKPGDPVGDICLLPDIAGFAH